MSQQPASTYAQRLQQAFEHSGKVRKSLSLEIGCSVQAIGMTLSSKKNRPLSTVAHCVAARYLGVDATWLATGEGEMTSALNPHPIESIAATIKELAGYLSVLDADGRSDAGELLRNLAHRPLGHERTSAMLQALVECGSAKSVADVPQS